jgi:hypothetical protein
MGNTSRLDHASASIEAECGKTSTFAIGHRVISAVTDQQAQDDGFDADDEDYHIARYKAYYRRNITCLRDECPSPWSFDCVPTSDFDPDGGLGHATPGGYIWNWSDATVTRGCTECTGLWSRESTKNGSQV